MAGIGFLFAPLSALDTPFIYKDVDHLMRVVDTENSPVMKKLNAQITKEKGVRILYNFYFGTRQLTCDRAIKKPEDLAKVKIRSIPFPIYMAGVEKMGAVATPVNWSEVPTALATGIVNGQENPVDVIYNNKLFELQSHLMLTSHIMAAECDVINEKVWQEFPEDIQKKNAGARRMNSPTEKQPYRLAGVDKTLKIFETISVICLFGISVVIMGQILLRNLFSIGFPWADELSRLLHIALIFLVVPILYRERALFKIDLFVKRLPMKVQFGFRLFSIAVCVGFCIFFMFSFMEFMHGDHPRNRRPGAF